MIRVFRLQFVEIPQVLKPLFRFYHCKMNIQISVGLLCRSDHSYKVLHCTVNFGVLFLLKKITRSLNPFCDILHANMLLSVLLI